MRPLLWTVILCVELVIHGMSYSIGIPSYSEAGNLHLDDSEVVGHGSEPVWNNRRSFLGGGEDVLNGLLTAVAIGASYFSNPVGPPPFANHKSLLYGQLNGVRGAGAYPFYRRFQPPLYAGYYGLSGFGFH